MKDRTNLFNPVALMATPETTKKHQHQHMRISGGDIGGVLSLGGSLAVAGLVAIFAMKTRLGSFSWRRGRVPKKQENDSRIRNQWLAQLNSLDLSHKMKPQYLAAIAEEPKSPAIDGSDLPLTTDLNLPLMEQQSSLEKLIIWRPLFQEANPEAESLLPTIQEAGEEEDNEEDDDEYEYEEDESVSEGEAASRVTVESSSAGREALIWPGEELEELSRQVKEMKSSFGASQDGNETISKDMMEK